MTLRKLPDTGQLLLDDVGRLYAECCCDPPPEGGWFECVPQYCAGDYASRFPNVTAPKFMVYFSANSFNKWRDNGFPSVLYNRGPAVQTYVIGEFLTGASDPKPEGFITDNGWLSLGSSDGELALFETSPTFGGAFSTGLMTSVPPPEFTVVDANARLIVHIIAQVQRGFGLVPNPPASGSLALAAGQYKSPDTPPTATLDIGQLPAHSEWRVCDPIIDEDPDSPTSGAILGFEQSTGTLPGFGPITVPAVNGTPTYDIFGSFDNPDELVTFGGRQHRIRGSAQLRQEAVVNVDPRAASCDGVLDPPPAFRYTFAATLHLGSHGDQAQCGNNPTECNEDSRCGCPDCVIQGPPCFPESGIPGLPTCDFVIANGGEIGVGMESGPLPICTAYRDELPSGAPRNIPYLGSNESVIGPNVSYANTGYCRRRVSLDNQLSEIGFSTMGISF